MPAQMSLTRDNDVIHTLAPDRSYQPFGKAILPRRGRCNRLVSNAHGSQSACDDGAIDPIAITDHVTRSPIPRKSLSDLACDPLRHRVGCDVDPDEISAIKPYNHEAVKHSEANGRDNEQIHSDDVRCVVMQKVRHPWLGGPRRLVMYLATLDCATSNPSLSSSPWMRGAPQSGFSMLIDRISIRSFASI